MPQPSGLPGVSADSIRQSVLHFLASLDSGKAATATFEFQDSERENWHFIPRDRSGLSFEDLSPAQGKLAHGLLASVLSSEGLRKVEQIMFLEQVLYELENQNPVRDPNAYFFSVFGRPDKDGFWGWRFEGHHVSLNLTLQESRVVSTGPAFLGANPARILAGPLKDLRVLGEEEDLGRQLVLSLSESMRRRAVISDEAPADILTGSSRVAKLDAEQGLTLQEMSPQQTHLLQQLIGIYAHRFRPDLARARLDKVQEVKSSAIRFAWAGGTEPGQPHYYRIQGPTFLIEYDNTQNNANHVHTVWRDLENDFGRDLLGEHYRRSHH